MPIIMCGFNPATDKPITLIVGGADHKSGEADDADLRFEALEAWARNLIPKLARSAHRWSGQVLDTIDYAAFIGRNPGIERIFVHTGDSGQGMTHGVAGSLINSALILGEGGKVVRGLRAAHAKRRRRSAISCARTRQS